MKVKTILTILKATASFIAVSAVLIMPFANVFSDESKEYRKGQIVSIDGKDYVIAGNKFFVEILAISGNKLSKISEARGMEQVIDLYAESDGENAYLYVTEGRYITKYDISNPSLPEISIKRDLYEWRGKSINSETATIKGAIGYMRYIAGNDDYIFASGSKGVKSFVKDNLWDYKTYTYERAYGLHADADNLYVLTADKGLIFNIESGEQVGEYDLANNETAERKPVADTVGKSYWPADNSLVMIKNGERKEYHNPVAAGLLFSYASGALPDNRIYYVNGFGVSGFDSDFKKVGWTFTANPYSYGANAWAVGVDSAETANGKFVVVFNKSSVLLLDEKMKFLSLYSYEPLYGEEISTDLNVKISRNIGTNGESVAVEVFGFWPNEEVEVSLFDNSSTTTVNNLGYGETSVKVPSASSQKTYIEAVGQSSGLKFQTSFEVY